MSNFLPNVNMFSAVNAPNYTDTLNGAFKVGVINEKPSTSFKDVLAGMVTNVNDDIQKPDELLTSHMSGNAQVDVHDIVAAMAKADLSVSLAAQVTSKVVSAYNTVMQISV